MANGDLFLFIGQDLHTGGLIDWLWPSIEDDTDLVPAGDGARLIWQHKAGTVAAFEPAGKSLQPTPGTWSRKGRLNTDLDVESVTSNIGGGASITFDARDQRITIGAGSWSTTPSPGDRIQITGTAQNNITVHVQEATSTTIDCIPSELTGLPNIQDETVAATLDIIGRENLSFGPELETIRRLKSKLGKTALDQLWLFKMTRTGPLDKATSGNRLLKSRAELWTDLNTQVAAMKAVMVGAGVTPILRGVFLQIGSQDIELDDATYTAAFKANLEQFISDVRTDFKDASQTATDIPVVLYDVHSGLNTSVYPGLTRATIKASVRQVTEDVANVRVAEIDDLALMEGVAPQNPTSPANAYLTPSDSLIYGQRLYSSWVEAEGTDTAIEAVPVYVQVGQSQDVGTVNAAYLTLDADPEIVGAAPWTNAFIYDFAGGQFAQFDPETNCNTHPNTTWVGNQVANPTFGSEARWLPQFALNEHSGGVYLYKLAVASAGLATVGALPVYRKGAGDDQPYKALEDGWNAARASLLASFKQPDVQGIMIHIGETDASTTASADAFEANLRQFIDDLRATFATRYTGGTWNIPVVLAFRSTTFYSADDVAKVKAAHQKIAGDTTNVTYLDLDTADIPVQSDTVHYTGNGILEVGDLVYPAFKAMDPSCSSSSNVLAADIGAAALVVEDGTGRSDADSYLSTADADTFHANNGNPAAWSGATDAAKEAALRQATRYIDARYAGLFKGHRRVDTQALLWPRYNVYLDGGETLVSNSAVPARVKDATAILALKALSETLLPDVAEPGTITLERVKAGPIESETRYLGGKSQLKSYSEVEGLLRELTNVGRVVRA